MKLEPEKYRLIILDRLLKVVNSKCEGKKSIYYNAKRLSKLLSISINTILTWYYNGKFPCKKNMLVIERFLLENGDTMTDDRIWLLEELWCFQEENELCNYKLAMLIGVRSSTLKKWRNGVLPVIHKIIERMREILYVNIEQSLTLAKEYNKMNSKLKPVYQIDKDTDKIIRKFKSMAEANRELGINPNNIGEVCKGNCKKIGRPKKVIYKTAGGFKWKFCSIKDKAKLHKKSKPVYQIDKDTNEIINVFYSIKEASKAINIFAPNISAICNNSKFRKTAGGYKWKFVND